MARRTRAERRRAAQHARRSWDRHLRALGVHRSPEWLDASWPFSQFAIHLAARSISWTGSNARRRAFRRKERKRRERESLRIELEQAAAIMSAPRVR